MNRNHLFLGGRGRTGHRSRWIAPAMLFLLGSVPFTAASASFGTDAEASARTDSKPVAAADPKAIVDELLAADRAFAAAAANRNAVEGWSAMYDEDVIVPLPDATFALGKAQAVAALRANPANASSTASWTPVRGGVSADGRHGFTFGYVALREPGKAERSQKYLSYWVKRPDGWRVAAYKRMPHPAGEITAPLPPALPDRLVTPVEDPAAADRHRAGLDAAERAFSDEAQKIGIGAAFARHGSADAMNMGRSAAFTLGAENIGHEIAESAPPELAWAPDGVLVASSGDLGLTWGMIRVAGPLPPGRPAKIPFFTIWRKAGPDAPWRYVAE